MPAAIATFTLAATLIVLLPGPDTLVVVRSVVREGRAVALRTVGGVLTGLSIWVCAAALGLSALLHASHDGYLALRFIGAAYLIWMGAQSFRARRLGAPLDGPARSRSGLAGTGYLAGLSTDLLNPKVGVFFVTFLPGFVPHGEPVGPVSLLLGAIFIVETAAYFGALLAIADRITMWLADQRKRRRMDRVTGLVLIGFGLRLAIER